MKKYSVYKDSGIEWIGDIPEHWGVGRLKQFCINITDGSHSSPETAEHGKRYISVKDIDNYRIDFDNCKLISEEDFDTLVRNGCRPDKGDILLTKDGTIGRAFVVGADNDFVVLSSLGILKPNPVVMDSVFLRYYLTCSLNIDQMFSLIQGSALTRITITIIKNLYNVAPPLEEQQAIVTYLDRKTEQVDTLISNKEKLIELLQEERTALINQAVTKGLNPDVPMKDSGVEWLGEIPEHWEVKRMRYLCDIGTGDKDTENREEDGIYPFYVRSQTVERISTYTFDGEAILTAGDGVGVCKVWHYVNERFDYHQRVYRMSHFTNVLGKYLFYYLRENFVKEVMKLSAKSTVDSLRRPMFQNFLVAFGPEEEQREIIDFIEKEGARIDIIITKTQQEIELLKEYRTALISEVVTGKIDVREEVLELV
jgi:type I restriction enzyme S subunit